MTAWKTKSWFWVSGFLIGAVAYIETENVQTALITALVSSALKTPLYALHEYLWGLLKEKIEDEEDGREREWADKPPGTGGPGE